jgi:hypothetical protein
VHQNTLDIPFLFDDRETVLLNDSLIAAWDWRAILHNAARPVVNLSFAIDRALWGFSSFGFHITNVILHIVTVGLFYGLCTRVLGAAQGQTGVKPGSDTATPDWGAFFAAAIFAAHPVMGAAVGYVTARSELLAAAGFLAALIYARRAIVAKHRTSGILAIVFGVLAVASSSSAAVLPLIVLAFDAWVLRDPGWTVRALRIYAPATLAVASAAAWHVTGSAIAAIPSRGPIQNLLVEVQVVWRYLALLVMPRGQALVHDARWVNSVLDPLSIAMLAALTAAGAMAIWKRRTYPLVAFGVVWFIGVLAPTTSFIPVRDAMAEHRLYLASAGLLLAAASVSWRTIASRRAVRVALAGVVFVLAVATYRRNEVWARPVTLWEEAVRRAPNTWQSHWGYAELLREIGQCDRARPEYDAVLRLYPDHAGARAGLAICRQP